MPTATIKLKNEDGTEYISSSIGTGPVDAALKAVDSIVKVFLKETVIFSVSEHWFKTCVTLSILMLY